jgi:recombination protein RecA
MTEKRKKRESVATVDLSKRFEDFVKFRIPTGVIAFDIVTGGGIPAGKLTEIYGDFSSGKTRIACHIMGETQRLGGKAVFLDVERSLSQGLLDLTGVDAPTLIYPDPDTELLSVEDIFEVIEFEVNTLREEDPDGLLTIVWDSVASTPGLALLEGEIGVNTTAMRRAKLIGEGLQKIMADVHKHKIALIFINQIRDKINVMYGDKYDTVGGKAIKFIASMRVHCKLTGKIKNDQTQELDGYKGKISIDKSKVCKPFGVVNFEMLTDSPIDQYSGLLDYYVRHGKVEAKKGWYNLPGEEKKFRKEEFPVIYEEMENGKDTNS